MQTNPDRGLHGTVGRPMDAAAYERYVGRLSRLYVPELLAAAGVRARSRVLDVATGTGEAARLAMSRAGESGYVVGTDISTAMLRAARDRPSGSILLVAADGQALAFRDAVFDAVICQLGLMFFPDPARGIAEFRRVLRRGGRIGIGVISTPDRAPLWGTLAEALSNRLPERRQFLHLSFSLADPDRLTRLLEEAGFRDCTVIRESRKISFTSFDDYWEPIELGAGQMPQVYLALPEPTQLQVRDEVRKCLARFESDGRLNMTVEILIASGIA